MQFDSLYIGQILLCTIVSIQSRYTVGERALVVMVFTWFALKYEYAPPFFIPKCK